MTKWAAVLVIVAGAIAIARGAEPRQPRPQPFVVHEWGVLVTSRTNGTTQPAAAAQVGPPAQLLSGLPDFVPRHDAVYEPHFVFHAWKKPVIHFYGPDGLAVKVGVDTPMGEPLSYWPSPDELVEKLVDAVPTPPGQGGYSRSVATGMRWQGTLSGTPSKPPPSVAGEHWWSTARDVPGAWLNTKDASERFLFYEATAHQPPPLTARVSDQALTLLNPADAGSGPVVVIVNDGTKRWGRSIDDVPARASVRLTRSDVLAEQWTDERTLGQCAKQWRAAGMTPSEADAIVRVWRPDLLDTAGFLVIARMPAATYDKMFPLTIEPKPDELVRAALVFDALPGQDERADWLPALRHAMDGWATDLAASNFRTRDAAAARFQQTGDLARPYLKTLATDGRQPEVARAAAALLRQIDLPPEPATPKP